MAAPSPARKAPAKKAPARAARTAPAAATAAKKAADPRLASVPKHLTFGTKPYTEEEILARPTVEINLDGEVLTARRPDDGFLAYQSAEIMGAESNVERIRPLMQLVWGVFDDASKLTVNRRLRDPNDSFDHDVLLDMTRAILSEWGMEIDLDQ